MDCRRAACQGVVKLWHDHVLLGSATYRLAADRDGTVAVHLAPRALNLLKGGKPASLAVNVVISVRGTTPLKTVLDIVR
jgi:hypothetical protein